jgi:thymidylate synthase (FAD)
MSYARLIAFTQPIELEGVKTGEELVAYCARVSNPANQANHETAPRLLNYLVRNQHWSPFEMAHAVIEIQTTRDIARQILRHRSFSFQEFSQRYAEVVAEPVLRDARLQDIANRQNSTPSDDEQLRLWWYDRQAWVADQAMIVYQDALSQGIAKEVARSVLPEGLTPSRLYMSGSVRSWIHYIQLRAGNGTQQEHRDIAVMCKLALLNVMPSIKEILDAP